MRIEHYWGHSFLPDLIQPDGIVFDFGVYDGGFSRLVAPHCARVIGFEPDPSRQYTSLPLPQNVRIITKAIAAKPGAMSFYVNSQLCSSLHYTEEQSKVVEVETVTFADALALEAESRIDLIKMDIEGEEVELLRTAPPELFTRVRQITVEFHDFLEPKSVPAIRAVIRRLQQLGFHAVKFSWNTFGDMLFVNQNLVLLSYWQRVWLRVHYKYVRGIIRVLGRFL